MVLFLAKAKCCKIYNNVTILNPKKLKKTSGINSNTNEAAAVFHKLISCLIN